jgi:hypothetical protein
MGNKTITHICVNLWSKNLTTKVTKVLELITSGFLQKHQVFLPEEQ